MDNDKKKQIMNMKRSIGLYRVVKAENQEELAEMDKNGQLPDNVCLGGRDSALNEYYYTYASDKLMTKEEEEEYIRLTNAVNLDKIKKQSMETNENVKKIEKYFKFFYVLGIIELVVGVLAGIIALIVNCSGK